MNVYFDNAATTKMSQVALDAMIPCLETVYANASSLHTPGQKSKEVLEKAREEIAACIGAQPNEIYFTSGGSEADNQAIVSAAKWGTRRNKKHIISTTFEHHAVLHTLQKLEKEGYEVTYLDVHENGMVRLEEVEAAIRPDTILVTIMTVNNEMGAIEPIEEIGRVVKECNPNTWFHTDAIQAYGKIPLRPKLQHVDMMSVSGHKLHGPKGVGFLYKDEKIRLRPLIYGGGQQEDMRSGTHDVPGIAGLGLAAEMACAHLEEHKASLEALKDYFIDSLDTLEGVTINSERGALSAPNILSVSFEKVRAEVLLHALEEKGIYVSSGSACSSNHPGISGALKAIGVKPELLDSTIRFSFGAENTKEEVDICMDALRELLPVLRRFTRF